MWMFKNLRKNVSFRLLIHKKANVLIWLDKYSKVLIWVRLGCKTVGFRTHKNIPLKVKVMLVHKGQGFLNWGNPETAEIVFNTLFFCDHYFFKQLYVVLHFVPAILENQFFVFMCFLYFLFWIECFDSRL